MSSGQALPNQTPAEQAEHELRKASNAAHTAPAGLKRSRDDDIDDNERHLHRRKQHRTDEQRPFYSAGYGPLPSSSTSGSPGHHAYNPGYDYAQVLPGDRLWNQRSGSGGAMGNDERPNFAGASFKFNPHVHVPRRRRGGVMDLLDDELDRLDDELDQLDAELDQRYAEWDARLNAEMDKQYAKLYQRYAKWNAELDRRMREQAEDNARKAKEEAVREETKRVAEEEERMRQRRAWEKLREAEARALYETRWKALLAPGTMASADPSLGFADIPWPIYLPYASNGDTPSSLRVDDLTIDAVSAFLLPASVEDSRDLDALRKERRDRLRDAMLRFHPDKFEGRVLPRVRANERDIVREAVGIVTRMLNTLMAQTK